MTVKPTAIPLRPDYRAAAPKHLPFVRAAFAVAQGQGVYDDVQACLRSTGCAIAPLILNRADATVATTTTSGHASQLATESFGAFLADLGPYSGASKIIAQAMPAPLGASVTARYPVLTTAAAAASWVAEGGAIPVQSRAFTDVTIGPKKTLASIVAWSSELGRRSNAFQIFERVLRESVGAGIDGAFFSTDAVSASVHPGLLNGVTALAGYAGGDDAALKTDLTALGAAVATGGSGSVLYVMAPERLARLRILSPELARSLDIAVSAAISATRVVAVDPAGILVDVDPSPEIFTSEHAVLHMSDAAGELVSAAGSVSDPLRSAFQTDTLATRIVHQLAFAKRRSSAAAYVDSVTW